MSMSWRLAIALEAIGFGIGLVGIAVEYFTKADLGYTLITAGAVAAAFGSMLFAKVFRRNK